MAPRIVTPTPVAVLAASAPVPRSRVAVAAPAIIDDSSSFGHLNDTSALAHTGTATTPLIYTSLALLATGAVALASRRGERLTD